MTIRKISVAIGDARGAMAAAAYPLDRSESPAAFAPYAPGGGANAVTDGDRPHAIWVGSDAALGKLGLHRGREVTVDELALALEGRHAVTGEQVRKPGSAVVTGRDGVVPLGADGKAVRHNVVNSFDLTFSAPKSFSIVWSQADAKLRAALEQAMIDATNAALEHIALTRPVISGKEPGTGVVASLALHVAARTASGDEVPMPQVHVHAGVVGVLDQEENLRTPSSYALYKHGAMREAGAVARAVLARRAEELGLEVEARTGQKGRYFEIRGVPRGLIDRMSGRSRDVAEWVRTAEEAKGPLRNFEAARGALATRAAKTTMDPERIQRTWTKLARSMGFGPDALQRLRLGGPRTRVLDDVREEVRGELLRRVFEEGPTVPVGVLRAMAFELAPVGLTVAEAGDLVREMQARGELIALDEWRVTTRDIRAREEFVRRVATEAGAQRGKALPEPAVEHGTAVAERELNGHELSPEQRRAVAKLSAGAGWNCLTGLAGTGKGPVLQAVAEAHRFLGWKVVAAAVDGANTQRLGQQIRAPAQTIQQMLYRWRQDPRSIDARTLIVIEEASKVGLRDWEALAELRRRTKARFLVVGDVGQAGAIESPGMLDVMLKSDGVIPVARLHDVLRHRDPNNPDKLHPWLGDYQRALYAGKADKAIKLLRDNGAIHMHDTRAESMVRMVDRWEHMREQHRIAARKAIMIVHGSNADIDQVNRLAQQRRWKAGELGNESVLSVRGAYRLHAQDVVMLREAAYRPSTPEDGPRVENGTLGTIRAVDPAMERVWVDFDDPAGGARTVMVDMRELRARHERRRRGDAVPELWLAYAGHPFPMQGATFEYVGTLWGRQGKEDTYSGDTRAKFWLDVFTNRETLGWEGTEDDRYDRQAKRLSEPSHKRASITYATRPTPIMNRAPDPDNAPRLAPAAPAPGIERPDPLDRYAKLLGTARVEVLDTWARAAEPGVARLDLATLYAIRDAGMEAAQELNGSVAWEVRRIEEAQVVLGRRMQQEHEAVAESRAEAERPGGFRRRRDARARAEEGQRRVDRDAAALEAVRERELELRADGEHPDDWVREHGATFANGVAAQRRIDRELELRDQAPGDPAADLAHDPAAQELVDVQAGPGLEP